MSTVHGPTVHDETCRQVLRSTAAGTHVRFRLSNATSATPIRIGRLTAAIRTTGAATGPTTEVLTKGKVTVTLAPGAEVVTDQVLIPVHAGDDVAVSFAVRGPARLSAHMVGAATGWCSGRGTGDHTADSLATAFLHGSRDGLVVESLEVQAPGTGRGVIAVGDSLTDAPLSPDTYQRWIDVAAARTGRPVANAAIAGNRVLLAGGYGPTVIKRFRRDVLDRPGADTVIVFAGTNDVSGGISSSALTARLQELCRLAKTAHLRVVLVTLPPAWRRPAAQEAVRRQVNAWIRTTRAADAHIDADELLRDPARPTHLLAEYDQGDGLHLSAKGHAVLGEAAGSALSA
ncbi:MAG: hypothetical protein JJD92_02955 [Frankiaceae bacterium]|nr:hypothetical protein [Frankiaceae bacterium]